MSEGIFTLQKCKKITDHQVFPLMDNEDRTTMKIPLENKLNWQFQNLIHRFE